MKKFSWALLVLMLMVALIVLVVALPNTTLAWMRSEIRWLGHWVNWVEALWPGWNSVHLLLFGALGVLTRLALPRAPLAGLLAGLVVFAGASEVLQFWAPGRTPRLSDFAQDVLGAMLGVVVAMALMRLGQAVARSPSGASK